MRRLALVVAAAVFLTAANAYAATTDIGEGMVKKAVNGAVNLFTGILEVPVQTYKGYHNGFEPIKNRAPSKAIGTVFGFFRGIVHAAGRMAWGGMELCGFWTANRPDNAGIGLPLDAKYAWEEGQQYSIFKPSLEEGVKPIGRKLQHGVADALLGVVEVPSQMRLWKHDGNIGKGFIKGVWFWFSREVYGFGSIMTCIVPNPEDNPGYPLNEKWAWSGLK